MCKWTLFFLLLNLSRFLSTYTYFKWTYNKTYEPHNSSMKCSDICSSHLSHHACKSPKSEHPERNAHQILTESDRKTKACQLCSERDLIWTSAPHPAWDTAERFLPDISLRATAAVMADQLTSWKNADRKKTADWLIILLNPLLSSGL